LETYFHNDPRIRKWINQIIERIFTVCILTGVDSDEEFQKGCQIVMKLTALLKEIPTLPSEFLVDGIKQLMEQQLPDALVINNFPQFQVIMERMLNEGILKATDSVLPDLTPTIIKSDIQNAQAEAQAKADVKALEEALAQAEVQAKADVKALEEALAQAEAQAKADVKALEEAHAQAEVQAKADVKALEEAHAQAEVQAKADVKALEEAHAQAEAQAKADVKALEEAHAQAEVQAKADVKALEEALAQAEAQAKADVKALEKALAQAEVQAKADAQALAEALAQVNSLTKARMQVNADALAFADALTQVDTKLEAITKSERYELAKPMSSTNDYFLEHVRKANNTFDAGNELQPVELVKVPDLFTSINTKISQLFSTSLVPQQADLLRRVLCNFYPNSTVYWNKSLMGQTFLAQVEDLLICLHDPEYPCDLKKYSKDGWKVLVCSNEDLTFPRRLERRIRQIQRSGTISATV